MILTDRELLEKQALSEVCACQYYDLADSIETESDETLQGIINHTKPCDICGK